LGVCSRANGKNLGAAVGRTKGGAMKDEMRRNSEGVGTGSVEGVDGEGKAGQAVGLRGRGLEKAQIANTGRSLTGGVADSKAATATASNWKINEESGERTSERVLDFISKREILEDLDDTQEKNVYGGEVGFIGKVRKGIPDGMIKVIKKPHRTRKYRREKPLRHSALLQGQAIAERQ